MAFGTGLDNVLLQPGVGQYNLKASGNITGGAAVCLAGDNAVCATTISSQRLFGIAVYTKTDGNQIAIAGPGNIVKCRISGTATAGTKVGSYTDGHLASSMKADYPYGIVVEAAAASQGEGKVLLL